MNTAKALLISAEKKTNTHAGIVKDFDTYFVITNIIELPSSFSTFVYQINKDQPTEAFAKKFVKDAKFFVQKVERFRV